MIDSANFWLWIETLKRNRQSIRYLPPLKSALEPELVKLSRVQRAFELLSTGSQRNGVGLGYSLGTACANFTGRLGKGERDLHRVGALSQFYQRNSVLSNEYLEQKARQTGLPIDKVKQEALRQGYQLATPDPPPPPPKRKSYPFFSAIAHTPLPQFRPLSYTPKPRTLVRIRPPKELVISNGQQKEGWVYFITAENGLTKIGRTANINKRLSQLRTASPCRLRLFLVVYSENQCGLEKSLHLRFAHCRVRYEWFKLTEADLGAIKQEYGDKSAQ